jgi:hypothetical protein
LVPPPAVPLPPIALPMLYQLPPPPPDPVIDLPPPPQQPAALPRQHQERDPEALPPCWRWAFKPFDRNWPVHYMGQMDVACPDCGALHWLEEQLRDSRVGHSRFGMREKLKFQDWMIHLLSFAISLQVKTTSLKNSVTTFVTTTMHWP